MPATTRKPAAKPARTLRWFSATGTAVLTVGGKSEAYDILEVRADVEGVRAFACRKLCQAGNAENYRVLIAGASGTCSCKGWIYRSDCRHRASVAKLVEMGKL